MVNNTERKLAVTAMILSNYGSVRISFYALEEDFNNELNRFNQIIDSFEFDEGSQYLDGQLGTEKAHGIFCRNPLLLTSSCLCAYFLQGV